MGSNPNSADADEWRNLVQKVLAVWSGYQLAVDFNSAGPETLERHKVSFSCVLCSFFKLLSVVCRCFD